MPSDVPVSANVVPLAPRSLLSSSETGSSALVESLRSLSREFFSAGLDGVFSAADDDLFKRSETGDMVFFEGLRAVRLRAPMVRRHFLDDLLRQWALPSAGPVAPSVRPSGPVELQLVEDSDLEERLALGAMISPADHAQGQALNALRQRWALVCGGRSAEGMDVPCSPTRIAEAFGEAVSAEEAIALQVRIVLYKHFERHVMAKLGHLYGKLNEALASAGVLPALSSPPLPSQERLALPSVAGPAASLQEDAGEPPSASLAPVGMGWAEFRRRLAVPEGSSSEQDWGSTVSPSPRRAWVGGGMSAASLEDLSEALVALRELQGLLGAISAAGVAPTQLKEQLLEKLGQQEGKNRSLGEHEAAIDAIGLVFDHVLNDPTLPAPVQALLARLQVPFIRVAIADPHLLESPDQPARRLLDALGEAGKAWGPEADGGPELWQHMESAVTTVHDHFHENPAVFEEQLSWFETQRAAVKKRSQAVEHRSEQVAQSRDKMTAAQAFVAKELVARTAGRPLPEWLRTLLLRHWQARMVMVVLREGEGSAALRRELFFVEKVVQAQEEKSEGGRRALDTLIPSLLMQLQEGLAAVAVPEEERESVRQAFEAYLTSQTQPQEVLLPSSLRLPGVPVVPVKKKGDPPPSEHLARVRALRVNDWLELVEPQGPGNRVKVSWISAVTGRLLLVTLAGLRWGERTPEELGWMFEKGEARVLESRPLFDRALGAIMKALPQ